MSVTIMETKGLEALADGKIRLRELFETAS